MGHIALAAFAVLLATLAALLARATALRDRSAPRGVAPCARPAWSPPHATPAAAAAALRSSARRGPRSRSPPARGRARACSHRLADALGMGGFRDAERYGRVSNSCSGR